MATAAHTKRRAWADLAGRRIGSVGYNAGGFVRLCLDDGTFVDLGCDDGFDEQGMRLVVTGDLEDMA